ncbi:hypothetical protein AGMMS49992_18040 [Clostridia bacterium]|nr:hypothetical protein AGMMS49992_18040 [Clostridia bacterium]
MFKRTALTLILIVGLLTLAGCTTGVNPPSPTATPEATTEPSPGEGNVTDSTQTLPVRTAYTGTIDSIEQDRISLIETGSDRVTIIITVTDSTYILDADNGGALAIDSLKKGTTIVAVTRPIVALSEPPQTHGLVIFTNLPTEGLPPTFAIIKEVTTDTDGTTWLVTDENVNWRVSAETPLIPYKAGAPITFDQLKPGMQVVGWYSVTTRSIPAQATPDKILVLPAVAEGQ